MTVILVPSVDTGVIVVWSGSIVNIPDGFVLCDGTNGTPDLRDKFVPGAGLTYVPGANGGVTFHQHTFTTDGHTHGVGGPGFLSSVPANVDPTVETDTGTTQQASSLPPYYALAYIMKT